MTRERLGLRLAVEGVQGVGAEEPERVCVAQPVPERFERERALAVPLGPEYRDHLAEGAHVPPALRRAREDAADHLPEPDGVGRAVLHEARERRGRVEREESARVARRLCVQARDEQAVFEPFEPRGRRDDDARFARFEPLAHVAAQGVEYGVVTFVELYEVVALARLAPTRRGRVQAGRRRHAARLSPGTTALV
jgi:hypothetical protein